MRSNPDMAMAEKALMLKDIIRFFKYHAWIHEPRPQMLNLYGFSKPTLPFLLFDFQKRCVLELVKSIQEGRDQLVEKSRDMGVSWMVVTIILWFWLQRDAGNDFLLGSRKYEFVDKKGSLDTLLEKFRYNLYRLQPVMLPEDFDLDKHDNVGFILNPETGSFIHGESNNANFGSGGRYKAALLDEFSKWEETDDKAWTSMGDSTPCRIPVSTPWGLGRKFAQLRFSGAIKVMTLHWSLHPIKSAGLYEKDGKKRSPWYDTECERRSDDPAANIGQELDIDYLSSGTPYFDNEMAARRYQKLSQDPPRIIRYEFERRGEDVKLFPHATGRIFIHEEPDPIKKWIQFRYCIACDVAEGLEKRDFSYFVVYDRVQGKDVAWFHGHCDTDVLAILLFHFSKKYYKAYIGPESNNHGHAVIQKLKSFKANMMFEREFSKYIDLDKEKLGWNTNKQTRPIQCAELREALNEESDGILDKDFFNEAMTFIYNKNGKPEAEAGNYDDRILAQSIKFQLHKWLPAPVRAEPKKENTEFDYEPKQGDNVKRPEGADAV